MIEVPQIVQSEEQPTAVIHLTASLAGIEQVMDPAIREVLSALAGQGASPAGPCLSFHLRRPTDTFDFEVGFPVSKVITPVGRVRMSKLPTGRVASTVYRGAYEGLGAAWGEFGAWIESEGLEAGDVFWESYATGPESRADPNEWRTRLNRLLLES